MDITNNALSKAIKSLQIKTVNIQKSNFFLNESYEPFQLRELESEVQDETPNVIFEVSAIYCAYYRSNSELDEKALEAFSQENVGYNVWPYWREFVQSTSARMNIPTPEIPFYFCSSKAAQI